MFDFIELIRDHAKVVAGAIASLLALIGFGRKGHRKVMAGWKKVRAALASPDEVKTINSKLDEIITELKPNSGKSLRDSVNHIELQVVQNQGIVENWLYYDDQAFARANGDGTLAWINRGFEELMGITSEQAMGWGWAQAVHPEHLERVTEEWLAILAHPRPWRMEVPYLHSDGTVVEVVAHGRPIYAKDGGVSAWVCSAHRKRP